MGGPASGIPSEGREAGESVTDRRDGEIRHPPKENARYQKRTQRITVRRPHMI